MSLDIIALDFPHGLVDPPSLVEVAPDHDVTFGYVETPR